MPAKGSNRATGRVWQAATPALRTRPRRGDLARRRADRRAPPTRSRGCAAPAKPSCSSPTTRASRSARWRRSSRRHGIPAVGDVITSAMAAAALVEPGERVLVCAGPGVVEALERAGRRARCATATPTRCWWGSTSTSTTSGCGSRLAPCAAAPACSRPTTTRRTRRPTGRSPAAARSWRRSSTATGVEPVVAGQAATARWPTLVRRRLGDDGVMVGDRPDTDGRFAAGARLPVRARAHRRHPGRGAGRAGARPGGARPR